MILLVNAQINSISLPAFFPIFDGDYTDFTVEWYKIVGATISLTVIINIITPHISAIIKLLLSGCSKCCDRGCTCNRKKTR